MRIFLIPAILVFSIIIVAELVFIYSKSPQTDQLEAQSVVATLSPTTSVETITYSPERQYSGRVISLLAISEDDYVYELTYTNQDNLKASIKFDSNDLEKTTIQYLNNNSEIIEEKKGLELDSLQFQDRFDIMITFDTDNELNRPNDVIVNAIQITVYKDQ